MKRIEIAPRDGHENASEIGELMACLNHGGVRPGSTTLNGGLLADLNSRMNNHDLNQFPSVSGASEWLAIDALAPAAKRIGEMVVNSPKMREVLTKLERISLYVSTVLIRGESGTGKELIAEQLHALRSAPRGPFITFNCSNLVESLAESTLFGHVRGAFTDARQDSAGHFRSADGGTLFLDEIGELPLQLQPKLLRAVELREVQPVGSSQTLSVNIQLITATNRDLSAMVKEGQFRQDLYRLTETVIEIPPLRERRADVEALTAHFITHYNRLFAKDIRFISSRVVAALTDYEWPGNVRELSNTIQSAVLHTDSDRLDIA
jgi:transcriptional regulator with GAF, ATPase, and Fis domain